MSVYIETNNNKHLLEKARLNRMLFSKWMEKELIVCKELGLIHPDEMYEHLKRGSRSFEIDPEDASIMISNKLEI